MLHMKRAFLFSVIFVLLFTVFLLLSAFYLHILQSSEIDIAQAGNITRVVYTRDDIATDLLDYLQLAVNIESNSTNTLLNISDVLTSPYSNPNSSLNSYKSIINGTYSNQTNLLDPSTNLSVISLDTASFESSPSLSFLNSNSLLNLRYSYNNLSKNELIINGSSLMRNYSVTAILNNTCMNNNCTNATFAGGPPTADSSTVGMWHFDEGSGTTAGDSSGSGNNGTLVNSPSWVEGRFGSGLQFTHSGPGYVQVVNSPTLNMNNTLTIEAWIKLNTSPSGYQEIIDKENSTHANYRLYLLNTEIHFDWIHTELYGIQTTSANLQPDIWYHVAVVYNYPANNVAIYINGMQNVSSAIPFLPMLQDTANLTIGTNFYLLSNFSGIIDEVAIYNRSKSADEIAADANLFHWDWGPIAINSNLSAAWHLDESAGTNAADSSGNGCKGTIYGATWNSSGKSGYALTFDGTDDYVEVPDSDILDVNRFTFETWLISNSDTQSSGGGCAKVTAKNKTDAECGGTYPYALQDDCSQNNIGAYIYTSAVYSVMGPPWSSFNNWTHIAMTYNGSTLRLYVNGTLYGENTTASGNLCANSMPLIIGAGTTEFFNGTIDEVAIYSRAKSADEIYADANPIYISLDVRDALNSSVTVRGASAGYINPGGNSTFHLKTNNNGMLNMTTGAYAGFYSLRMYANNTRASLLIKTVQEGVSSIQLLLPVRLRIYQQTFANLIIAEK